MKSLPFAILFLSTSSRMPSWNVLTARAKPSGAKETVAMFQPLLDEAVMAANISDNTSRTTFTATNKAKGKTVVRDNRSES